MFLVRSAFWLTVAFIAIHPKDVDLGATAGALSNQAIAAGQQMVVERLLGDGCTPLGCVPAKKTGSAPLTANLLPAPAVPTLQASPTSHPAPFPRPRPDWLG